MNKKELRVYAEEGYKVFAAEANMRSTLNVFDGLKPVHRRILFQMYILKMFANKPHVGSGKLVGGVLSDTHPHGDTAVYEAAIRLTQEWKMRYPLVDVYGNKGSVLFDTPAAMRYTKMKLTPLGELCLTGLKEKAVPMQETYNGETYEPVHLAGIFPNLLCNGGIGIGAGISNSVLPHNLTEVCNGIIACLDKPTITIEELMQYIPAPDLPTGGVIINPSALVDAYRGGAGNIKVRGKYHLEQHGGYTHIVFTEIPYLTSVEKHVIDKIKEMVFEENYQDIYNIENKSGKDGINIHIIVDKKANVNNVLETLFKRTGLERTLKINFTVQRNGSYVQLGLKGLINSYIAGRDGCITITAKNLLEKLEADLHIQQGLVIAIANIDEVVSIIKTSQSKAVAQQKLIDRFNLTEVQSNAVLEMKLGRLTSLEIEDLQKKITDLKQQIQVQDDIITYKSIRVDIIKQQLQNLIKDFGDGRRTEIKEVSNVAAPVEIKPQVLVIDDKGIGHIVDTTIFEIGNKGTTGKTIDYTIAATIQSGQMIAVDKAGSISLLDTDELDGVDLSSYTAVAPYSQKDYVIFLTKNGYLKTTLASEYKWNRPITGLKLKADDYVTHVFIASKEDNLIIANQTNMIRIPVAELHISSRATLGAKNPIADYLYATLAATDILILNNDKGYRCNIENIPTRVSVVECSGIMGESPQYLLQGEKHNRVLTLHSVSIRTLSFKSQGSKLYNGSVLSVHKLDLTKKLLKN